MVEDLDPADILDDISELSFEMKVPLRSVPRRRFETEAATESHQGVMARADPLPESSLLQLSEMPNPHLLVLDGVTDPGNLGALLRTAECAGVTGVVLPRHRAARITPTVTKSAAGAIEHLRIGTVPGIPNALSQLRAANVWVVGLDEAGERSIHDVELGDDPIAVVMGAEGTGMSRLARSRCDVLARIPMRGVVPSLNVSAAAAVTLFEIARRRTP